ncbi:hypothetical protein A9Q99_07290 [Gammaproteobacteria bacterium 45_16_T64]|nr:hypothetical protein A9Q99_07290 [Gammaproteobacteria bacterium 45_16_T64]
MVVCICNRINDRDIRNAIHEGASSFSDVRETLGVGSCCGQCAPFAKELVDDTISQLQISQNYNLAYEAKV